jgi:predicted transposase YbfD/YdcC
MAEHDSFFAILEKLAPKGVSSENGIRVGKRVVKRLMKVVDTVPDPRQQGKVTYPLYNIIVLAFFAVVGGCKTFLDIAEFYKGHPKKLKVARKLAGDEVRIPSHDTFERVFSLMEPAELEYVLMNFVLNVLGVMKKAARIKDPTMKHICVDGKSSNGSGRLKGTILERRNLQTLHVYDSDQKICIASIPIAEKTNEIPTAQRILRKMDLSKTVVTFDAMNTQKETIAVVVERGGFYVAGLKGNHQSLCEEAKLLFSDREMELATKDSSRHYFSLDKANNKVSRKAFYAMDICGGLFEDWVGLCTLVRYDIDSEDCVTGAVSHESRYYISNIVDTAEKLGAFIHRHWSVEVFHWHLDRTFGDDDNQTTNRKAACNLGIMKKFVYSLYNLVKTVEGKKTMSSVQRDFLFDYEDTLIKILSICDMSTIRKTFGTCVK